MWTKKGHEFDEYAAHWDGGKDYILYGAGNLGKAFFDNFKSRIRIAGFSDSDGKKIGTMFCGKRVERVEYFKDTRIIVTSRFYGEIKAALLARGLREDIDFTPERKFEAVFEFYANNRLVFREFDICITTRCTLNCAQCNMQISRFQEKADFPLADIRQEVDLYFQWVDQVEYLGVLGGEPFLHPELCDILRYIAERYRGRIGRLEVLTNGTCEPSERFWDLCQRYRISIQLSDYSAGMPALSGKVKRLAAQAKAHGTPCYVLKYDSWLDFELGVDLHEGTGQLRQKFSCCNNPWRSVYHGKYYYCHLQTSAYRAGLTDVRDSDVFDLSHCAEQKKIELLEFDLGKNDEGYLSFCRFCRGCSDVNDRYVPPAVQEETERTRT